MKKKKVEMYGEQFLHVIFKFTKYDKAHQPLSVSLTSSLMSNQAGLELNIIPTD